MILEGGSLYIALIPISTTQNCLMKFWTSKEISLTKKNYTLRFEIIFIFFMYGNCNLMMDVCNIYLKPVFNNFNAKQNTNNSCKILKFDC